jgi:hypothetical protein
VPEQASEPSRAFLTGDEAVRWFMGRKHGGHLFDAHMSLIEQVFGADVPIQYRAAIDPSSGKPTVLIVEIIASFNDDAAWDQLVSVQARLLESQADLAGSLHLASPFSKIVISLRGIPTDWDLPAVERESEQ